MFYLLSQISIVVYLVSFVILFVGYWTYADYYTKMSVNLRAAYFGSSIGVLISVLYVGGLVWAVKTIDVGITAAVYTAGAGTGCIMIVFGIILLNKYFQRSREFFRKKRAKIC